MEDYKQEIRDSRTGALGSSDGETLRQVASLGYVPKSAYKRMAVCKGLIEQQEIPQTAAVRMGDEIEMALYANLKAVDGRHESNPCWVSKKYSRKHVRLLTHPDIVLKDDDKKVLTIVEVKASKYSYSQTRDTYKSQLFIHQSIGEERAKEFGKGWTVKVLLAHYSTDGLDLDNGNIEFDPQRLTVKQVRVPKDYFDIGRVMDIINDFLETFTEYYEGDEIDADLLPDNVRSQFVDVANILAEITEREKVVDEFKKRLYDFMVEKGIKSIKNDVFSVVRVDPTESTSFDAKAYINDMMRTHPRKAKKVIAAYNKKTKRSGYALIKTKKDKQPN